METETRPRPDAKTLFARMCIDGTRFQAQKFVSAVEDYEGLGEAINQGEEITPNYLPLLSDVFSSFFQNKARLKQNPPRKTAENREIMETTLGLKEYEELHSVSRLDFFASAAASSRNGTVPACAGLHISRGPPTGRSCNCENPRRRACRLS